MKNGVVWFVVRVWVTAQNEKKRVVINAERLSNARRLKMTIQELRQKHWANESATFAKVYPVKG